MEYPWSTPGDQVHVRVPAPAGFSGVNDKVESGLRKVLGLEWSTPGVPVGIRSGCWLLAAEG